MSFDFNNNINQPMKAQSAYKDASGMGGGGMYMKQKKKRKENEQDDDIFERQADKNEDEITLDKEIPVEDIPEDAMFNRFVNWFRIRRT